MKFLAANFISIPRDKPREKVETIGRNALSQSKSHKGHSKSIPSSNLVTVSQSGIAYMVEALKLLTERSSSSASVQSTLVANQEVLKLDLMKLVVDVGLIRKHLKLDEASSTIGPPKEEEEDVDEEEVEEEDVEKEDEEGNDVEEEEEEGADAEKGVTSDTSDNE
ncbi:hypothetical protein CJ030_MR5G018787 [Morella rubra]|uniref:Uncharacterized protein n=1 Tax=Morella rubra TaxID=262757 RepID=A0A6A1VPZ0_9ROSI|nr:hypothetical protein CJ030_MR5G018787 [Morella rubra]